MYGMLHKQRHVMSHQEVVWRGTPYFFQRFVWVPESLIHETRGSWMCNKLTSFSPGGATWHPFTVGTMVQWCCLELTMDEVQPKKLHHIVSGSGLRRVPVPGDGNDLKLKRAAVMFSEYWMIHDNTWYERSSCSIAILLKSDKAC